MCACVFVLSLPGGIAPYLLPALALFSSLALPVAARWTERDPSSGLFAGSEQAGIIPRTIENIFQTLNAQVRCTCMFGVGVGVCVWSGVWLAIVLSFMPLKRHTRHNNKC